jgi:restriction system protein
MARKKINSLTPTFDELIVPTIKALQELGGSGSIEEINNKVYVIAEISDDTLQIPHGEGGSVSEVDYRLAWSRTLRHSPLSRPKSHKIKIEAG